ncbi:hypothetical protein ACFPZ0_03395 [Streptomonospora nanhaiensis]|uniref:Fumarylacetoacetase-like C-terminal domain-containing protein n=1 Tax=Streptomonospora nanhaiensis TaxID=1323731 RepID=A0A853BVH4_9ACTN|nr:hypothetical protein [Streptomonospora nanhaiensis]MBV2364842.1 hypothetical protein [Streptomonospora nanhaiensis]MBX9387190.1 hypothetical protein [Streptomonospora nanhaiensis]NYI98786.1 hypothetical protein [Streptomonospora nanhaiensis]
MRWVTYLSPSGGLERPGVVDDGCVFGYPGDEPLPELLGRSPDLLADAFHKALAAPVEIIVEFETRLCAPISFSAPVPARVADAWTDLDPALVRGTDDGVALPPGAEALVADIGVLALFGERGRHTGYAPACLWSTPEGHQVALTTGPAVVTPEEFDGSGLRVAAAVEDTELAAAAVDGGLAWASGAPGAGAAAVLPARTRPLEAGEELFVDGGPLGEFEIRVGSGA